jgi:hypothetical protein
VLRPVCAVNGQQGYLSGSKIKNRDSEPELQIIISFNYNALAIEIYKQRWQILGINIYSFPMKFHPITGDYSHNRDFIGEHWNIKYIRAVQAILNITKGKIGKGKTFFYKAFGHTEEEFFELLEIPETFILYRFFFEWLENTRHQQKIGGKVGIVVKPIFRKGNGQAFYPLFTKTCLMQIFSANLPIRR